MSEGPEKLYIDFAETLSGIVSLEKELHSKKRLMGDLKSSLGASDCDGGFGTEISAHAFKQISERLESLALENAEIYKDVMKQGSPHDSLLMASNMKSFIITTLANARQKSEYATGDSRNGGKEYRFTVDIKKWSGDKTLQFVAIVENNVVKTGFFNWV